MLTVFTSLRPPQVQRHRPHHQGQGPRLGADQHRKGRRERPLHRREPGLRPVRLRPRHGRVRRLHQQAHTARRLPQERLVCLEVNVSLTYGWRDYGVEVRATTTIHTTRRKWVDHGLRRRDGKADSVPPGYSEAELRSQRRGHAFHGDLDLQFSFSRDLKKLLRCHEARKIPG